MTDEVFAARAARLAALHEARCIAELRDADAFAPGSDSVPWSGVLLADVMLVKGRPGPAEASGGAAMSGVDGAAVDKALEALGWPPDSSFRTLSQAEPAMSPEQRASRLLGQIEAVDPALVIALDQDAADDVVQAFGIASLPFGVPVTVQGRRLLAVSGFESSLNDPAAKRRVWRELQAARRDGPVY